MLSSTPWSRVFIKTFDRNCRKKKYLIYLESLLYKFSFSAISVKSLDKNSASRCAGEHLRLFWNIKVMILRGKVILSCIKKRRLLSESHASTNPLKQKSLDLRKVFILKNITSHGQNHAQIRPLELTASIFGQVCRNKIASTDHKITHKPGRSSWRRRFSDRFGDGKSRQEIM